MSKQFYYYTNISVFEISAMIMLNEKFDAYFLKEI